jgi:hypothetical protein
MFTAKPCIVAFGALLCFGGIAEAQSVDNPAYQVWSIWREGASVTTKTELTKNGKTEAPLKQTQTLKSLSAEKAVIDASMELELNGKPFKTPPAPFEIAAKIEGAPTAPSAKKDPNAPAPKMNKGQEKLTINGKTLICEWNEFVIAKGQTVKTWYCDDVPGRIAKMVSTNDATKTTTVMVVVDFKGTKK